MRRIVLIVLALVVLTPAAVRASALYRCATDGRVRDACCCPAQAKHHERPGANTEIRSSCCCSVTQIEGREAPSRDLPSISFDNAPVITPILIAIAPIAAPIRRMTLLEASAPRGPPEPLFARHCSLLL